MVSGGMLRTTDASAATPEAVFDLIAAATPLGRVTTPDDMADAALFFASPWSRAVTGLNLIVDGGWSLADAACPGSYEALCVVRSQLLWQRGQLDLSRSQGN